MIPAGPGSQLQTPGTLGAGGLEMLMSVVPPTVP